MPGILVYDRVDNMQKVEREIDSRIPGRRVFNGYVKEGREKIAQEVIQCSFSTALNAYAEVTWLVTNREYYLQQWIDYEFN
jgi:hypothetical protein